MVRPSRSRPCLSPSSLEHTLNVGFVVPNLLSLIHWTCWLTSVVPTSHLSEARVELHVQEGVTGWRDNWAELSGSQSQRGYSSFATRYHLLSSHVQRGLNIGCTWSTWVPLPPAQPTALKTFLHHKPGSGTRLRINQEAVCWMIQCCLLPQAVNMNRPLQLGTILLTTSF